MGMITEQEAYENLCKAVVFRAYEDLVVGYLRVFRCRGQPEIMTDALKFFKDKNRLSLFTDIDGERIINRAKEKADYTYKEWIRGRMYKEYTRLVKEYYNE